MGYVSRHPGGPPAWFVFIVGVAFVFGLYYVWSGLRQFIEEGGRLSPTEQAIRDMTATMEERTSLELAPPTRRPTLTPVPECQEFVVDTQIVNVREQPGTEYASLEQLPWNTAVCVLYLEPGTDWFLIDRDTATRRIEPGYIRSDLLKALNPTITPTATALPPPSITPTPTPILSEAIPSGSGRTPTATIPPPAPTPTHTPTSASVDV